MNTYSTYPLCEISLCPINIHPPFHWTFSYYLNVIKTNVNSLSAGMSSSTRVTAITKVGTHIQQAVNLQ